MPPKLPPPSQKKSRSQQTAINAILAHAPGLRQYMAIIREAAQRWGIDPVFVLATLAVEDRSGNPNARNPSGATGLAQILDSRVAPGYNRQGNFLAQYGDRHKGGRDQATDPVWAINYLAWRMAGHIRKYGSLDAAYDKGYNPGFSKYEPNQQGPNDLIPKWYLGQAKQPASPADKAGTSVDTSVATTQAKAAAGLLFEQRFPEISSIWEAYTGKPATRAQAMGVYKAGWSNYHLELQLSKGKNFVGSPVWKQNAPSYMDTFHQIYGTNAKPDRQLVAYGIIHNLTASGFADLLRQRKDYVKSNEFKTNQSQLDAVYRKIYGAPNDQGANVIKNAVLHGWNPDEFAKYLRGQPEYSSSQEYQSNTMGVLDSLGMLTGAGGATLHPGGPAPLQGQPQVAAPPPDKRVKGKAGVGVQGPAYTPGIG